MGTWLSGTQYFCFIHFLIMCAHTLICTINNLLQYYAKFFEAPNIFKDLLNLVMPIGNTFAENYIYGKILAKIFVRSAIQQEMQY